MTRSARKGNKKAPLTATPWKALRDGPLLDENTHSDTDSVPCSHPGTEKLRRVRRGQLKETKKPKLAKKVSSERLADKFKKKLTVKKLAQEVYGDSDSLPLLSPVKSPEAIPASRRTLKKKTKHRASSAKEDTVPLLQDEGSDSEEDLLEEANDADLSDGGTKPIDEKRQRRLEARRLRRQKRKVCFKCRKPGHLVQECPSATAGICFKCGSAEHTSRTCQGSKEGEYPFAKCFICGELGHISRSCPDNPKGLYPNGGCCKLCGSVEHLKSNCPEKKVKNSKGFSTATLICNPGASADAEDDDLTPSEIDSSSNSFSTGSGKKRREKQKRTSTTGGGKVDQRPKIVKF